ncbi:carbohydrate esterase family 9 protein [Mycena olivaceomarginata]|nr:carbohydrate esterase family 9 protein [Mycena olivaceomarginata]
MGHVDYNTSRPRTRNRGLRIWVAVLALALLYVYRQQGIEFWPSSSAAAISRCRALQLQPGPPDDFHDRSESDRFVPQTRPHLVQNAKIWTGRNNGTEVLTGDILIDKGLIKGVGHFGSAFLRETYGSDLVVIDAQNAWVTPGIVDIHSHMGNGPSPALDGADDTNSHKATIQPWLRSLDGLNTHDDSYALSIAGGLILPGSGDAIGGQAFVMKLRKTAERSSTSMVLEPPYTVNSSFPDPTRPPRWRHMKHACGENPSGWYSNTRMDTIYAFRDAYNTASQIKKQQDEYCSKALEFPESLQWEALVDVVRGRVKVQIHCYEAVDFDGLVRLSNEFKFPISAFHHAAEAYLVPDLIKKTYGKRPTRYKREAYRHSEFAPRILAENGLTVLMKSDHPVMNSRHLVYEAQQAYFYGLPENLGGDNPAEVMGMGHRIGYIKEDLVIWDSHPLALGATPAQVFIDGIPQLESPYVVEKPKTFQHAPSVPNFDKEAQEAVEYDGLPPLEPTAVKIRPIVFVNVKSASTELFLATDGGTLGTVVAENGHITCVGVYATIIDLEAGSISPGLRTRTADGAIYDPLSSSGVPEIVGGDGAIIRAADGLVFQTRDAFVSFSLGAAHKLERGAVLQEVTAVHMKVLQSLPGPSVSTQIALLRRLLLRPVDGPSKEWFLKVTNGEIPLVIEAHGADIIASLILLKKEVEHANGKTIQMTITGASEAHLLAEELGEAGVAWRGPPLTEAHCLSRRSVAHNVTEIWEARNTRFEIAWALALGSTNVAKLLGAKLPRKLTQDLVATRGGDLLSFNSKVVAVISGSPGFSSNHISYTCQDWPVSSDRSTDYKFFM